MPLVGPRVKTGNPFLDVLYAPDVPTPGYAVATRSAQPYLDLARRSDPWELFRRIIDRFPRRNVLATVGPKSEPLHNWGGGRLGYTRLFDASVRPARGAAWSNPAGPTDVYESVLMPRALRRGPWGLAPGEAQSSTTIHELLHGPVRELEQAGLPEYYRLLGAVGKHVPPGRVVPGFYGHAADQEAFVRALNQELWGLPPSLQRRLSGVLAEFVQGMR